MKKVAVWLSDEEQDAFAKYCEKEGRSMYAVLKESVARVIGEESPVISKQDTSQVPHATSPQISPKLQRLEQRLDWQEKEIDKLTGNEKLWQEFSDLKAKVGELNGLVSGLLLKLTKTEELEEKIGKIIVDTMVEVNEKIAKKEMG